MLSATLLFAATSSPGTADCSFPAYAGTLMVKSNGSGVCFIFLARHIFFDGLGFIRRNLRDCGDKTLKQRR